MTRTIWLADIAAVVDPAWATPVNPRRHQECERKKRFRNRQEAQRELRRLQTINAMRGDAWPLHEYLCPHARDGHWHIGHVQGEKEDTSMVRSGVREMGR